MKPSFIVNLAANMNQTELDLEKYLNCEYDKQLARFFLWNQMPSLALMLLGPAWVGFITGAWWPLVVILAGAFVLWVLGLETRLLCSHCTFYAGEGRVYPVIVDLSLSGGSIWRLVLMEGWSGRSRLLRNAAGNPGDNLDRSAIYLHHLAQLLRPLHQFLMPIEACSKGDRGYIFAAKHDDAGGLGKKRL
jgi:hypothetical protein